MNSAAVPKGEADPGQRRALQGTEAQAGGRTDNPCGGKASPKTKWLILASMVLALGAAVFGSVWFGIAAVLPLLYVVPCLIMMGMCMKMMRRTSDTNGS